MPFHFSIQHVLSNFSPIKNILMTSMYFWILTVFLSSVVAAQNFLKKDSYVMTQIQQDIWAYFKKLVHIYPFQLGTVVMSSDGWFPHSFLLNLKLLSWDHYKTTGAYGLKISSTVVINLANTCVLWWCACKPFTDALCSFYRWSVHN